jgi:regulator of protease activity HflC (stomatin/prohibitin superfamily)
LEEAKTRAERLVGEAMLDAHKAAQAMKAEAEEHAEQVRAEAERLLEPARQEAARLLAEARVKAEQLVSDSEAEVERLASQAEQYKLLAAEVQQRSVELLQHGLEALGADPAEAEAAGDDVRPFRRGEREAAGE